MRLNPFYVPSMAKTRFGAKMARMNPDAFVQAAVDNTLASTRQGPTYFIRPAGSYVEGQTRDKSDAAGGADIAHWLTGLDWHEITDQVRQDGAGFGAVRYFAAHPDELHPAYEAVRRYGDLTLKERATVRVEESHHRNRDGSVRYELVSDLSPKRADVIVIAIGNAGDPFAEADHSTAVVYTWHPGLPTPMATITLDMASGHGIPDHATVKAEGPQARKNFIGTVVTLAVAPFAAKMVHQLVSARADEWRELTSYQQKVAYLKKAFPKDSAPQDMLKHKAQAERLVAYIDHLVGSGALDTAGEGAAAGIDAVASVKGGNDPRALLLSARQR